VTEFSQKLKHFLNTNWTEFYDDDDGHFKGQVKINSRCTSGGGSCTG